MRAKKFSALRSALTTALDGQSQHTGNTIPLLPVPPLIHVIAEYAVEDFTVTQLIGQTERAGYRDNCPGLKALLSHPWSAAVVIHPNSSGQTSKAGTTNDQILIAENSKVRSYSVSTGTCRRYTQSLFLVLLISICYLFCCRLHSNPFH
jgi:hypothetical protein